MPTNNPYRYNLPTTQTGLPQMNQSTAAPVQPGYINVGAGQTATRMPYGFQVAPTTATQGQAHQQIASDLAARRANPFSTGLLSQQGLGAEDPNTLFNTLRSATDPNSPGFNQFVAHVLGGNPAGTFQGGLTGQPGFTPIGNEQIQQFMQYLTGGGNPAGYSQFLQGNQAAGQPGLTLREGPQGGMALLPAATAPTATGASIAGRGGGTVNANRGGGAVTNQPAAPANQQTQQPANQGNTYYDTQGNQIPPELVGIQGPAVPGGGEGIQAFGTSSGDVNPGALPALLDFMLNQSAPYFGLGQSPATNIRNVMNQFLGQTNPNDFLQQILGPLSQIRGQGLALGDQSFAGLMDNLPGFFQQLQQLQQGLPGSQQVQDEQQQLSGLAGGLLGGTGQPGQYGLTDLLSQIYGQGLPNQRGVEGLFPQQAGLGQNLSQSGGDLLQLLASGGGIPSTGIQGDVTNTLSQLIQGGGLTPEFVQAQRNLVLDPSKEALMGQLNQLAGGQAELTSPQFQELLRRHERDFNDQLLSQGFQNMPTYLSQGLQAGGQQFGQGLGLGQALTGAGGQGINSALASFGAVPNAAYPYAALGGNLSSNLLNQSLGRFGTGGQLGLQSLNTQGSLLPSMLGFATDLSTGAADRNTQLMNSILGGQLGGINSERQIGAQAQQPIMQILNALAGLYQTNANTNAQTQSALTGAIGQGAAASIPALTKLFTTIFSAFSSEKFKHSISDYDESASEVLDRIRVRKWTYKPSLDPTQRQRIGPILEESPNEIVIDKDTIDLASAVGLLIKANQELRAEIRELRNGRT